MVVHAPRRRISLASRILHLAAPRRRATLLCVAGALVLGVTVPAAAVPSPWFGVTWTGDHLWGGDWPPGAELTVMVGEVESPSWEATTQVWPSGEFGLGTRGGAGGDFDIEPGMPITVSDGTSVKVHMVTAVEITGVNVASSLATGMAAPDSVVQVWVNAEGVEPLPTRIVTANGNGEWSADFANEGEGASGGTWAFGPGTDIAAGQWDDDGDHTVDNWRISAPWIGVDPEADRVWGGEFTAAGSVLITVDDLGNGIGVDFSMNAPVWESGDFGKNTWENQPGFDIRAGMIVTVTDGESAKSHLVTTLAMGGIDIASSVVTGTAEPGIEILVVVWPGDEESPRRLVTADDEGVWTADFLHTASEGDVIRVFGPGTSGWATEFEEPHDGDHTQVHWHIPNPEFRVCPSQGDIWGHEWPGGSVLTITVGDVESPDWETTVDVEPWGDFGTRTLDDEGKGFMITPGMLVTVTDGADTTKDHVVTGLTVTGVAPDEDTVSGEAAQGSRVWVWIDDTEESHREFDVPAGGLWTVDYDEDWIQVGTTGGAAQGDVDGDETHARWNVPNPRIEVGAHDDWIEGHEWMPGETVLVNVDDPFGSSHVATAQPDWRGYLGLWDLGGFDVKPGQTVTMSQGDTARTHVVTSLTVTGYDIEQDTVFGTAQPFGNVSVDLWDVPDGCWRETQADGDGKWTIDFTDTVGVQPWERGYTFHKGLSGRARESDGDGNQTSHDWRIPNPCFGVSWADDNVWGWDWQAGAVVTVTVGDVGSPSWEATAQVEPWGDFNVGTRDGESEGFDIEPGMLVTVTDGLAVKDHTVTNVDITGVDVASSVVTGTAEPGSELDVWIQGGGEMPSRRVIANGEGVWSADFADEGDGASGGTWTLGPGEDITAGQWDEDGDHTGDNWHIPNPAFEIHRDRDGSGIFLREWSLGTTLTITVEDSTTPQSPDFEAEVPVQPNDPWSDGFGADVEWLYLPGHEVTVTDGSTTKTHVVTSVRVTSIDVALDVVHGEAAAGSPVEVNADEGGTRWTSAGSDGLWHADFSVSQMGQPPLDLARGSSGVATQYDGDGDETTYHWEAINQPPVAVNDARTMTVNTTLTVAAPGVLANDTDAERDPLTAVLRSDVTTGALLLYENGSYTYRPPQNYTGPAVFTYRAHDGFDESNVATVTINVNPVQPPPPPPPVDSTAPVTEASISPGTWTSGDVTVTLSATDDSGIERTEYTIGTGSVTTYRGPFAVTAEGVTSVRFRSIDKAPTPNTEEWKTVEVKIDRTAPAGPEFVAYSTLTSTSVTLTWPGATDVLSGVVRYEVTDNGTVAGSPTATMLSLGGLAPGSSHLFDVRAVDAAGNVSLGAQLALTMPSGGGGVPVEPGSSATATIAVEPTPGSATGTGVVSVTITGVTSGGVLSVVRAADPPYGAPATLKFVGDCFDVSFTGTFTGTVTITLPYDPRMPDARAANLKLKHWKNNGWEDVPVTVDLVNHTITGYLSSLSPLAIVESANPSSITATITPSLKTYFPAYGASATVKFTLRGGAAAARLPAFDVYLERYSGSEWSRVATVTTGVSGTASTSAKSLGGRRTRFRFVLAPNDVYESGAVEVRVTPKAKLTKPRASTSTPRRSKTFYLTGNVAPKYATTGSIRIYKLAKGRWKYVSAKSFKTTSAGSYKVALKLSAGTYRFRALVGADTATALNARTYSSYTGRIRVR